MEYPTCHLYFLSAHTSLKIGEYIYKENTRGKQWNTAEYGQHATAIQLSDIGCIFYDVGG